MSGFGRSRPIESQPFPDNPFSASPNQRTALPELVHLAHLSRSISRLLRQTIHCVIPSERTGRAASGRVLPRRAWKREMPRARLSERKFIQSREVAMTVTHSLHRHAETLEHLLSYRTEPQATDAKPAGTKRDHFTIALSREAGTPAEDVAREVGQRLGWTVYDGEVPARIAQDLHVPVTVVEQVDERRQNWLLECLESFNSPCHLSESRYFRHLLCLIHALGKQGRCVIIGHGAEFILPARSTLRAAPGRQPRRSHRQLRPSISYGSRDGRAESPRNQP